MKNIKTLSQIVGMSTGKFVLFTMITSGFYPFLLFATKAKEFKKEMGFDLVSFDYILKLCIITGCADLFTSFVIYPFVNTANPDGLFALVISICWIMFGFKMREPLMRYCAKYFSLDIKANGFFIFLFGPLYIVYLINHMEAKLKYHNDLFGNTTASSSTEVTQEKPVE